MQIQRAKLLDALKKILSGVGEDQISDSAVFHGGWLSTCNGMISVSAPVEDLKDLNAVVKVKEFQKLVQKLKGDTIDIEVATAGDTQNVTLTCGNTIAELATFPDNLSASLNKLALDTIQWADLPKDFGSMLALCRLENAKWKFPVIHVTGTDMISEDGGIRANFGTLSEEMPTFSLHTSIAKELLSMGALTSYALTTPSTERTTEESVEIGGQWLHVFTAAGAIFSCQTHTEAYPASQRLAVKKNLSGLDPLFTSPIPSGLAEAVDRVETFAVAGQMGVLVRVHITSESMFLKTSKEAGNVSESLFWDVALPEGTDLEFWASVPYLREAAKKVQEFSVVLHETKDKEPGLPPEQWPMTKKPVLIFRGPDFLQFVMVSK